MSSWRTLLIRIGDRCPEYGGTVDYQEHIDTCHGLLLREIEQSKDDIFGVVTQFCEFLWSWAVMYVPTYFMRELINRSL